MYFIFVLGTVDVGSVFFGEQKSENFSLYFLRKIIAHMIILKLTICLTSTVTVRMKCLFDRVSAFALQQQGISIKFTPSFFVNNSNSYKA